MSRRIVVVIVVFCMALVGAFPAAAGRADQPADKEVYVPRLTKPSTPNPLTSYLPNATGLDAAWTSYLNAAGKVRASKEAPGAPRRGLRIDEREAPEENTNDTAATAEHIARFGTASGRNPAATVAGTTAALPPGATTTVSSAEPDGSLELATVMPIDLGDSATTSGEIGDEPAPDGPPDFDFFVVPNMEAGEVLVVDVDTPDPFGDLDSFVAVWNPDLAPVELDVNDDDGFSFDSLLAFTIPEDGDYWVSVGGFGSFVPIDPTDPASPNVTGEVGSEGVYNLTLSRRPPRSIDNYSVDLQPGDILGVSVDGGAERVEIYDPADDLMIGSSNDVTFIHPPVSPLPGGGNAAASVVAATGGRHFISVVASADYHATLRVFRPAKERSGAATQKIFIDFDGATLSPAIFGAPPDAATVELSPLADFLTAWGLEAADEDAVIDAIMASVEENLSQTIREEGFNGDRDAGDGPNAFDIELLNSRNHDDPWGDRYVSRVIVGGTIGETGIFTVGIAQSIDVGDFESEESALVLLDLLSGTGPFPAPDIDLNLFPRAAEASIIDLIGVAVGNITAHEAGHFFANWHTDQFNFDANIMDQGGNLPGLLGVGPDGVFGTGDDVDVDFGPDEFVPNEGFYGIEDTLQTISFGLSTGNGRGRR